MVKKTVEVASSLIPFSAIQDQCIYYIPGKCDRKTERSTLSRKPVKPTPSIYGKLVGRETSRSWKEGEGIDWNRNPPKSAVSGSVRGDGSRRHSFRSGNVARDSRSVLSHLLSSDPIPGRYRIYIAPRTQLIRRTCASHEPSPSAKLLRFTVL